ncbi:hypothetical protein NDA16_003671 [Ustilago loliicola]|nr:hypothetical protein NDA16_003671 [Ustilago loliicola]
MSDTDQTSIALPSGEVVDRPLTNKEKRQLAVAEKRKAKEAAKSPSSTTPVEKRKRQDDDPSSTPPEGEEEVLSHKEQRRRKKLAKLNPTDPSDPTDPNGLIHPSRTAGTPAQQPRSGFSIWIGNLSFFTPPAKLIDWFNTRGVDGISRVNMPKGQRRAEMNRGFCYLDLPSRDMLTAALNLSEQPLDGRKLLIKDGSDFTGRPDINTSALGIARTLPNATTSAYGRKDAEEAEEAEETEAGAVEAEKGGEEGGEKREVKGKTGLTKTAQKILRAQKNPPSMTLFLGNLSFNTTEQGVRDLFDHSASKRNPAKPAKKEKNPRKSSKSKNASSSSDSSSSSSSSDSDSDSDDDEEEEEEKEDEKDSKEDSDKMHHPAQGEVVSSAAGIRKVRLGTFEDAPTKCKGFGFLDFHTVEQATASLIDPRNTFLDGRKIILQYASADATRRGASKTQKSAIANRKPNELRVGFMRKRDIPRTRTEHEHAPRREQQQSVQLPAPGSFDPNAPLPKKHKETKEERIARRAAGDTRGGEAQRRASVAVVESTGTKVTFDD